MNALLPDPRRHARVDGDAFVNAWVGTPFAWDGRELDGVDCWGLVWRWHQDVLGQILPDWIKGAHSRGWAHRIIAEQHAAHWTALGAPADHAIVLTMPAARPAHLGICWRGGVLHADEAVGVVWHPLARYQIIHRNLEFGRYCPAIPADSGPADSGARADG